MAATQKQIDALARAREARRLKQLQTPEEGTKVSMKEGTPKQDPNAMNIKQLWVQALLTAMQSKEVRHEGAVKECVPIADEVVRLYREKFN